MIKTANNLTHRIFFSLSSVSSQRHIPIIFRFWFNPNIIAITEAAVRLTAVKNSISILCLFNVTAGRAGGRTGWQVILWRTLWLRSIKTIITPVMEMQTHYTWNVHFQCIQFGWVRLVSVERPLGRRRRWRRIDAGSPALRVYYTAIILNDLPAPPFIRTRWAQVGISTLIQSKLPAH